MKKITFILVALTAALSLRAQTNLLKNSGFEDDPTTFTVVENTANVLMRVAGIQSTTTQKTNPTSAATPVAEGLWVKKAPSSGYIKAVVTTADKQEGASALNLQNRANNSLSGLQGWWQCVLQQKVAGGLNNSQKYYAKFYAKVDETAGNVCDKVIAFVTDATNKTNISKTINMSGGTTWTEYTTPLFDIPEHIINNPTANFTTAFFGIGNPTTYNDENKTNYSGVIIDNVRLYADGETGVIDKKVNLAYTVNANGLILNALDKNSDVTIFTLDGKTVNSYSAVEGDLEIALTKGFYLVKVNNQTAKVLIK